MSTEHELRRLLRSRAEAVSVGHVDTAALEQAARQRRRRNLAGTTAVALAATLVVGAGVGRALRTDTSTNRTELATERTDDSFSEETATTVLTTPTSEVTASTQPEGPISRPPAVTSPSTTIADGNGDDAVCGNDHVAEVAISPAGRIWATVGHDSLATSADGGRTWTVRCDTFVIDGAVADVMGIDAVSDSLAWAWLATTARQPLVRTDDGGATWRRVTLPREQPNVSGGSFDAGGPSWVWGSEFTDEIPADSPCPTPNDRCSPYVSYPFLYRSSGGDTWEEVALPDGLRAISEAGFTADGAGWIVDTWNADRSKRRMFRTADGGSTWAEVAFPSGLNTVLDVAVISSEQVLLGVNHADGSVGTMATDDGGATWTASGVLGTSFIRVVAVDASVAVAATSAELLRTTDGGATWAVVRATAPAAQHLAATGSGRVVAGAGEVLISDDAGHTWRTATAA